MDYLTQHYKNLSEQLQAKVNHLNTLIRLSEDNRGMRPLSDEQKKKEYSPSKFKEDDTTLTDEQKEKYKNILPKTKPKRDEQPVTKKVLDDALSDLAKRKAAKQSTTDKPVANDSLKPIDVDTA
jgi:hypothetical protein